MVRTRPVFRGKWGISGPQPTPAHPIDPRPTARKVKRGGRVGWDGAFPKKGGRSLVGDQNSDEPSSSTYRRRTTSKVARQARSESASQRASRERTRTRSPPPEPDGELDSDQLDSDDGSDIVSDDLDDILTPPRRRAPAGPSKSSPALGRSTSTEPDANRSTPSQEMRRLAAEAAARRQAALAIAATTPSGSNADPQAEDSMPRGSATRAGSTQEKRRDSQGKGKGEGKQVEQVFIDTASCSKDLSHPSSSKVKPVHAGPSPIKVSSANASSSNKKRSRPEPRSSESEPELDLNAENTSVDADPIIRSVFRAHPTLDPQRENERQKRLRRQVSEEVHTSDFSSTDDEESNEEEEMRGNGFAEEREELKEVEQRAKEVKRKAVWERKRGYSNPRRN